MGLTKMLYLHCCKQPRYSPSSSSQRPKSHIRPLYFPHSHLKTTGKPQWFNVQILTPLCSWLHHHPPRLLQQSHKWCSAFHSCLSTIYITLTRRFFLKGKSGQVTACCKFSNGIQKSWNKILLPPFGLGGTRGSDLSSSHYSPDTALSSASGQLQN